MLIVTGAIVVLVAVSKVPVARLVGSRRRAVVRGLLGAAAVISAVGLLGLVAAVGNPVTWASNQLASSGEVVNGPGRFGELGSNNRTVWWGEAWQVFRANPAGGTGASTFEIARKRVRADAQNVSAPHSVPLQLLSDTGLPGFLLGVVFIAGVALGLRATLGRLDPDERAAAVGLVALPFAFGLHALVDLNLDFLAVAAPTMLVVGCAARRRAARCREGGPNRGARGRRGGARRCSGFSLRRRSRAVRSKPPTARAVAAASTRPAPLRDALSG